MPSSRRASIAAMNLLDRPLRATEFLVVDTETNGRAGEACELTEVGAVLVGGGELHDRWEAVVGVRAPLSRSIQRFTGITQAMVDEAPAAELVLGELADLLRDRVLVAHSAAFDRRVLTQAFAGAGLAWPDPPALCTVALARRFAPLARQRRLGALAASLGIEVEVSHRALADAETCARVLCALLPRLCAHATTPRAALELLRPARRRAARAGATDGGPDRRRGRRRSHPGPDCSSLPDGPGVYVFRNAEGQALYVGKSVALRTRARAHFAPSAPPAPWRVQAATVEHEVTASELGALLVEHRLIRRLRPPGNARAKHADPYVWLRCRFDVAYPALEVAGAPAPGHAVSVGPLRGRAGAVELMEQLNSLFGLRHCGRRLKLREHPSAYGQMGRCLSPCLNDLDPNLYRARLDAALGLFSGDGDGSELLAYVEARMRRAAEEQRYEQAAWLRRRLRRLEELCASLGTLRCGAAGSRLVLAPSPEGLGVADALWLRDGRVAGFVACVREVSEVEAMLAGPSRPADADDVAELRVVETWLATGEAAVLELTGPAGEGEGEGEVSALVSGVLTTPEGPLGAFPVI
jgi:DNA polymerase-3 subunit epsilon